MAGAGSSVSGAAGGGSGVGVGAAAESEVGRGRGFQSVATGSAATEELSQERQDGYEVFVRG